MSHSPSAACTSGALAIGHADGERSAATVEALCRAKRPPFRRYARMARVDESLVVSWPPLR
ncbi:hypothetical protein WJ24_27975 [Burkholderia vietnamiensis]|nr:hypothetical protein WJ01_18255 [Burkholderia vietnamiensis]KVG05464.1 hypothetical protein WJ24_27975 [Burkholderia vietnamiensis]